MTPPRPRVLRILALLVGLTTSAARGEAVFELESEGSAVRFTLDATLHEVHGVFHVASGEVHFGRADGEASGKIVVDATSGNTGNAKRDRKMHESVLRSAEFPRIEFSPSSVVGTLDEAGTSRLRVSGTLRLLGNDHPLEVPVEVTPEGGLVRARATLTVPYVAWGLEDPSVFVLRVGKTVELEVELVGRLGRGPEPRKPEDSAGPAGAP